VTINAADTLLLIIDVQNDFCPAYVSASDIQYPAGALSVNNGGAVVPRLNALATALAAVGGRVAATQDWHPQGHVSFASSHEGKKPGDIIGTPVNTQALWPEHCVQGSRGAAFHEELDLKPVSLIVRKGYHKNLDSYSAFFENDQKTPTGLEGWIRDLGIKTLIIGGLATDYCVFFSAMDAKRLSFDTIIASDAVRGVGIPEGSVEKAEQAMKDKGIVFASSAELLKGLR
jgi:nicotinamidase/pyrazinamidase